MRVLDLLSLATSFGDVIFIPLNSTSPHKWDNKTWWDSNEIMQEWNVCFRTVNKADPVYLRHTEDLFPSDGLSRTFSRRVLCCKALQYSDCSALSRHPGGHKKAWVTLPFTLFPRRASSPCSLIGTNNILSALCKYYETMYWNYL